MKTTSITPRKEALTLAWLMVKTARLPLSTALAKAWATVKLKTEMSKKPVSFFYTKDDGSQRYAVGHYSAATTTSGNGPHPNPLVVKYYDTLAQGWRSFRADRIIVC